VRRADEDLSKNSYQASAFFETLVAEIHHCTGSVEIGGSHDEILAKPQRMFFHKVGQSGHPMEGGDVAEWFKDLISAMAGGRIYAGS